MPFRRKTIKNGVIYDGHIPYSKQADSGKIPVVNARGEWEVKEAPSSLPSVTSADNGKVLGVTEGQWGAVNAPSGGGFIVTLAENNGTYTVDKTLAEILAAVASGIVPILKVPIGNNAFTYYSLTSAGGGGASFVETNIDSGTIYSYGFQVDYDDTVREVDEMYPSE